MKKWMWWVIALLGIGAVYYFFFMPKPIANGGGSAQRKAMRQARARRA
tara:strand:+ start:487 stop:630 length:144 start_codon:yes stop_codon:yes gene_type:complete